MATRKQIMGKIDLVVSSALHNAYQTVVVERSAPESEFTSIALASVQDVVESYGLEFTDSQLERIETILRYSQNQLG